MKKRVLSVILALGIILSNFPGGFAVIAEDGETTKKQQEIVEVEDPSQDEETTTTTDSSDDAATSTTTDGQQDETSNVELKVVLNDNFPSTIYYGQDKPDFSALAENSSYLPKYYHFELIDGSDEISENVYRTLADYYSINYVRNDGTEADDSPEENTVYNIQVEINTNAEMPVEVDGKNYFINTDLNQAFTVLKYTPNEEVEVSVTTESDGVTYLQTNNKHFHISQSAEAAFFSDIKVKADVNEDGSYSYYLMNVDDSKDNVYYGAISCACSVKAAKPQMDDTVEISGNGLDIKKGAFNQSVKITLTGSANAENAYFVLYNNNESKPIAEHIDAKLIAVLNQNGGQFINKFQGQYQIELPENSSIGLNLSAKMVANGQESDIKSLGLEQGSQTYNDKFVLENIPPEITNYQTGHQWWNVVQFGASDSETQIENVTVTVSDKKGTTKTFESTENNGFYQFDLNNCGFNGTVNVVIEVRDKAGNTAKYVDGNKVVDGNPPEIKSVTFQYENTNKEWVGADSTILRTYSYGKFANVPIRVVVKADDTGDEKTYNGIKSVELYDNNTLISSDYHKVMKTEQKELEDGTIEIIETNEVDYYYFDIESCQYDNLIVKVGDGNNYTEKKIGCFVIEKQSPTGEIDKPDFSRSVNGTDWYGLNIGNGEIKISVSDQTSGIASVIIKDGTTILNEDESDFTSRNEVVNSKEYTFPITDNFKDGSHDLSVEITDNCGNTNSKDITLSFNTDFTPPSGEIKLVNTSKMKIIDGQYWFDIKDDIKFNFTIDDTNPYQVAWIVDGSAKKTDGAIAFGDGIKTVSLTSTESGAALDENGEHKYIVSAVFYDEAGNSTEIDTNGNAIENTVKSIEVFKDFAPPTINNVTVSKTESGLDRVLRILSFGIYSNDKIQYTVKASDMQNDSGLASDAVWIATKKDAVYPDDFVEMQYDGEKDGQHSYTFAIPADGSVYPELMETAMSGKIAVHVTDKFGHNSDDFVKINGGDGTIGDAETNSKNFMIEQIKPAITINKPDSDGETRTDNTTWYNSDKNVTITVQDKDSGIFNVLVTVNGVSIESDSDGVKFLTESMKSVSDIESHMYRLSTDNLITFLAETNQSPQDGHYIIKVDVEDNSGNRDSKEIDYYIDKIPPKVESIDFSIPSADNYTDASQFIDILEYGFYFKTDLIATVNVSDKVPSSGLHRIEYNLIEYNNGVKGNENPGTALINENGQASFNIPNNFKGQIYVKGFDYVGNVSEEKTPQSFVVDTPERHGSEEHIEITGLDATGYTDSEGHPLYDTNVNLTVKVSDTISGIRDISYSISSEHDIQEVKTIMISNTGNTVGQDLGDGWTITAMDENLVTEVTRSYLFSADNNNIQLSFAMTDRANNTSEKISDIFSIDQTAPIINVVFDSPSGNNEYYRENRTATITVVERNFDASRITASITNEIGNVPGLSFTSISNTEHVATLIFGEGDYTFGIEGTDRCNHAATVNYSGGNERSFHVDMTDPTEIDNFDQFINNLENSFNIDKEMTFTITEHNFVPGLVNIRVYRTKAGQELTMENREDCTSEYISSNNWTSVGDTHTLSLKFTEDYVYQVVISATDASGRILAEKASPLFEIDKTAPILKTPANLDVLVFTSKNTETSATPLEFFDDNIASIHYSVVSYQMKLNEDNVGYDMDVDSEEFDVKSDSVVISNEFFNQDGIYEVKCVAYDVAGNPSEESTHTFVIQRDTDFLVYIPNSNKDNHTGLYKFDKTGIRSADFEDIEIITYITKDKNFEVQVDGSEVTDTDLDVVKDERRINQVDMYDVTLKSSYIAQNYNADTIDTDLALNAVAASDAGEQVITLGHIYIDNVKPVGEYESALQDLGTFDGFYGVDSRTVMIEGVSPDIDLNRCEIQTNDMVLKYDDGGFNYDADAHTISFTIEKGYTDIRPTLVDNAGNINNLPIIKKVYVGDLFARWWYLFIFGSLVVLAVPTFIVVTFVRRKKNVR